MIAGAAIAALLLAAQPVPEAAPAPVDGDRPSLCGMTAANVPALEAELARGLPAPSRDERYVNYQDRANLRLWTFTAPADPAHPAVACVQIGTHDGVVGATVSVFCGTTGEACDAFRGEFERRGEAVRRGLSRR
jgi:hypothetical protein